MELQYITRTLIGSLVASVTIVALAAATFMAFEPVISIAQTSETFTVQQTITSEISFVASTSVNNLAPGIAGQTGGYATGTAQVAVLTNDSNGYNMTIRFGTSTAHEVAKMRGDVTSSFINDYTLATATTTPDYVWQDNGTGQAGEFGFTVNASDTTDIHQNFFDNNTNCGIASANGGSYEANRCWMEPTSTAYTIIDRGTATPAGSGATTTIQFKVAVPGNPSPTLQDDTYTATVTITATANP